MIKMRKKTGDNAEGVPEGNVIAGASHRTLGELLLALKLITPEDLKDALVAQNKLGGRLGEILVKQGLVSEADVMSAISLQLDVPIVDLKDQKIDPVVLLTVSEEIARKSAVIPVEVEGDTLVLAMAYPDDIRTVRDIATRSGKRVQAVLALPSDILNAIDLYYKARKEIENSVGQVANTSAVKEESTAEENSQTPIAQTLELILKEAAKDRASDIHIEPQESNLRVRFRIDGILQDMYSLPISVHAPPGIPHQDYVPDEYRRAAPFSGRSDVD